MAQLEKIRPKIIPFDVCTEAHSFTCSSKEKPDHLLTLPIEFYGLLDYFNGENTFTDIAKAIYSSEQNLSFRRLLKLAEHMANQLFLTNWQEVINGIDASYHPSVKANRTDTELSGLKNLSSADLRPIKIQGSITNEQIAQQLSEKSIFQGVSIMKIQSLSKYWKIRKFPKNLKVISQGTDSTTVFLLLSGKAGVYTKFQDNSPRYITSLGKGSLFGEYGAFFNIPRTADIIAETDCEILVINIDKMKLDQKKQGMSSVSDVYSFLKQQVRINQSLGKNDIFSGLPQEILNLFTSLGHFSNKKMSTVLIKEGEVGDAFYVIVKGAVSVSKNDTQIAQLKEGDFFGEVALIKKVPRTATVTTLEDSLIMKIHRKDFYNLLCEHIGIALLVEKEADKHLSS